MDDPERIVPDYGESFADVYDEWYATITDAEATADRVATLVGEAGGGRVLELGIGSGRLALPIARRGIEVVGIDSSRAMVELLGGKPGGRSITVHLGDMADASQLVDGPFAVVLVAFNTLFNVADEADQQRCLCSIAELLSPDGSLLVEAFVPGDPPERIERDLSTSRVTRDRVVLSATEHDPVTQTVVGQHIDITESGIRLRPWQIRYLSPTQLDAMATAANLQLVERHSGWRGEALSRSDAVHVSRYRPMT